MASDEPVDILLILAKFAPEEGYPDLDKNSAEGRILAEEHYDKKGNEDVQLSLKRTFPVPSPTDSFS